MSPVDALCSISYILHFAGSSCQFSDFRTADLVGSEAEASWSISFFDTCFEDVLEVMN